MKTLGDIDLLTVSTASTSLTSTQSPAASATQTASVVFTSAQQEPILGSFNRDGSVRGSRPLSLIKRTSMYRSCSLPLMTLETIKPGTFLVVREPSGSRGTKILTPSSRSGRRGRVYATNRIVPRQYRFPSLLAKYEYDGYMVKPLQPPGVYAAPVLDRSKVSPKISAPEISPKRKSPQPIQPMGFGGRQPRYISRRVRALTQRFERIQRAKSLPSLYSPKPENFDHKQPDGPAKIDPTSTLNPPVDAMPNSLSYDENLVKILVSDISDQETDFYSAESGRGPQNLPQNSNPRRQPPQQNLNSAVPGTPSDNGEFRLLLNDILAQKSSLRNSGRGPGFGSRPSGANRPIRRGEHPAYRISDRIRIFEPAPLRELPLPPSHPAGCDCPTCVVADALYTPPGYREFTHYRYQGPARPHFPQISQENIPEVWLERYAGLRPSEYVQLVRTGSLPELALLAEEAAGSDPTLHQRKRGLGLGLGDVEDCFYYGAGCGEGGDASGNLTRGDFEAYRSVGGDGDGFRRDVVDDEAGYGRRGDGGDYGSKGYGSKGDGDNHGDYGSKEYYSKGDGDNYGSGGNYQGTIDNCEGDGDGNENKDGDRQFTTSEVELSAIFSEKEGDNSRDDDIDRPSSSLGNQRNFTPGPKDEMPPRDERHGYLKVTSAFADNNESAAAEDLKPRESSEPRLASRPDSRSENLSERPGSRSKRRSGSQSIPRNAKVLYDFDAQNDRELNLKKGAQVMVLEQIDANWYRGEYNGRVGIFPIKYVKLISTKDSHAGSVVDASEPATTRGGSTSKPDNQIVEGEARAKYDFIPRHSHELALRSSETIVLMRKVDDNWWEGRSASGKRGIFPSNYVQVVREPVTYQKYFANPELKSDLSFHSSSSTAADTTSHGSRIINSTRMHVNGQPRQMSEARGKSEGLSNIAIDRSVAARGPSADASFQSSGSSQLMKEHKFGDVDTYTALYQYKPANPDELELDEGDVVMVVEKCDDGWYIGTSLRTGQFGTFPGNYVQLM